MTVISLADYRKRVGVKVRCLMRDGHPMTQAEFNEIPQDDMSNDTGVVIGWVNLCRPQCATRKDDHVHIVWTRDKDGELRVTAWRASDRRLSRWSIPQLFVLGEGRGTPPGAA